MQIVGAQVKKSSGKGAPQTLIERDGTGILPANQISGMLDLSESYLNFKSTK